MNEEQRKEQAAKNLHDFATVLNSLGLVYWLEGGTLLGAYRDGDFCKDDENDIDIGSWFNYQHLIPEIVRRAENIGFTLYMHWDGDERAKGHAQEIAVKRHDLKIDLFFYEKKGLNAWTCVYDRKRACTPRVAPSRFFEELEQIHFKGAFFNRPRRIEEYLTLSYGDWRTPVHRSQYSCYNENDLKVLQPKFVFWE